MKKTIAKLLVLMMVLGLSVSAASAFTPPGLSKKGGLPPGIQKRFIQQVAKNHSYEASIKAIDYSKRRIVIQEGTAEINLLVANDAKIELNGKSSSFNNLQVNDQAVIKTNSSNTVVELKVTGGTRALPPQVTDIKGVIKTIDLTKKELIIEDNNTTKLYKLTNAVVYIDNNKRTISELKVGMEITAKVEGIEVKTIHAKSIAIRELEATVKALDINKREIVLQHGNKEELYTIKTNAVVKINGVTQRLSDIKVGTIVTVKIQLGEITEINVNNGITQFEGRLMVKNTGQTPTITVEINNQLKTYNVSKELNLANVNVGKQIVLYIKDNLVIAVHEKN